MKKSKIVSLAAIALLILSMFTAIEITVGDFFEGCEPHDVPDWYTAMFEPGTEFILPYTFTRGDGENFTFAECCKVNFETDANITFPEYVDYIYEFQPSSRIKFPLCVDVEISKCSVIDFPEGEVEFKNLAEIEFKESDFHDPVHVTIPAESKMLFYNCSQVRIENGTGVVQTRRIEVKTAPTVIRFLTDGNFRLFTGACTVSDPSGTYSGAISSIPVNAGGLVNFTSPSMFQINDEPEEIHFVTNAELYFKDTVEIWVNHGARIRFLKDVKPVLNEEQGTKIHFLKDSEVYFSAEWTIIHVQEDSTLDFYDPPEAMPEAPITIFAGSGMHVVKSGRVDFHDSDARFHLKTGAWFKESSKIQATLPKLDVMFSFDCSGSMIPVLATTQALASAIVDLLSAEPWLDARFGVISYVDYPANYSYCGYATAYGAFPDYPYRLDQPLTFDPAVVKGAIGALLASGGMDTPQCHARVMYEGYSDSAIGWRAAPTVKVMIDFTDNVPHDCNLNEGLCATNWTTGCDPGRDGTAGTTDDIDLQDDAIPGLVAKGIEWFEIHARPTAENATYGCPGLTFLDYWKYWAGLTDGRAYGLGTTTVAKVAGDILGKVPNIPKMEFYECGSYELQPCSWVLFNPCESFEFPKSSKINLPASKIVEFPAWKQVEFQKSSVIDLPASTRVGFKPCAHIHFPCGATDVTFEKDCHVEFGQDVTFEDCDNVTFLKCSVVDLDDNEEMEFMECAEIEAVTGFEMDLEEKGTLVMFRAGSFATFDYDTDSEMIIHAGGKFHASSPYDTDSDPWNWNEMDIAWGLVNVTDPWGNWYIFGTEDDDECRVYDGSTVEILEDTFFHWEEDAECCYFLRDTIIECAVDCLDIEGVAPGSRIHFLGFNDRDWPGWDGPGLVDFNQVDEPSSGLPPIRVHFVSDSSVHFTETTIITPVENAVIRFDNAKTFSSFASSDKMHFNRTSQVHFKTDTHIHFLSDSKLHFKQPTQVHVHEDSHSTWTFEDQQVKIQPSTKMNFSACSNVTFKKCAKVEVSTGFPRADIDFPASAKLEFQEGDIHLPNCTKIDFYPEGLIHFKNAGEIEIREGTVVNGTKLLAGNHVITNCTQVFFQKPTTINFTQTKNCTHLTFQKNGKITLGQRTNFTIVSGNATWGGLTNGPGTYINVSAGIPISFPNDTKIHFLDPVNSTIYIRFEVDTVVHFGATRTIKIGTGGLAVAGSKLGIGKYSVKTCEYMAFVEMTKIHVKWPEQLKVNIVKPTIIHLEDPGKIKMEPTSGPTKVHFLEETTVHFQENAKLHFLVLSEIGFEEPTTVVFQETAGVHFEDPTEVKFHGEEKSYNKCEWTTYEECDWVKFLNSSEVHFPACTKIEVPACTNIEFQKSADVTFRSSATIHLPGCHGYDIQPFGRLKFLWETLIELKRGKMVIIYPDGTYEKWEAPKAVIVPPDTIVLFPEQSKFKPAQETKVHCEKDTGIHFQEDSIVYFQTRAKLHVKPESEATWPFPTGWYTFPASTKINFSATIETITFNESSKIDFYPGGLIHFLQAAKIEIQEGSVVNGTTYHITEYHNVTTCDYEWFQACTNATLEDTVKFKWVSPDTSTIDLYEGNITINAVEHAATEENIPVAVDDVIEVVHETGAKIHFDDDSVVHYERTVAVAPGAVRIQGWSVHGDLIETPGTYPVYSCEEMAFVEHTKIHFLNTTDLDFEKPTKIHFLEDGLINILSPTIGTFQEMAGVHFLKDTKIHFQTDATIHFKGDSTVVEPVPIEIHIKNMTLKPKEDTTLRVKGSIHFPQTSKLRFLEQCHITVEKPTTIQFQPCAWIHFLENTTVTEVKNTLPNTLDIQVYATVHDEYQELPKVAGAYYMCGGEDYTEYIDIHLKTEDFGMLYEHSYLYINGEEVQAGPFRPEYMGRAPCWRICEPFKHYVDYVDTLNITAVIGNNTHTKTFTQWVYRDTESPLLHGVTVTPIKGGVILEDFNATDNIGIGGYNIYVYDIYTTWLWLIEVTEEELYPTTLTEIEESVWAFNGKIIIDLTWSQGDWIYVDIYAKDWCWKESLGVYPPEFQVEGYFHIIELHGGFNLISLPLIPPDPDGYIPADLFGAIEGLKYVYEYDPTIPIPWKMYRRVPHYDEIGRVKDGKGYLIEMEEGTYNILVVDGYKTPPPEWLTPPPTYPVLAGWNLKGFKSTEPMLASEYLASLQTVEGYWKVYAVYAYDPAIGLYPVFIRDTLDGLLIPGKGYWMYMLAAGEIVPP